MKQNFCSFIFFELFYFYHFSEEYLAVANFCQVIPNRIIIKCQSLVLENFMTPLCNFENNDKGIKKGYICLVDLSISSKLIFHINAFIICNK